MSEGSLLRKFLLEYTRVGSRLFRNNTGMAWTGKREGPVKRTMQVILQPGDMVLRRARPFHSGFPKGSSDLIGWTQVQITPDMVGKHVAVFTAAEVKTGKLKATVEQKAFIRTVNEAGGIGVVARKLKDLFDAARNYIGGDNENTRH